ncbi:MAG: hypothetical protein JW774_09510 [Candidatus Aureabacteria bacterium]|nr:hypothetical protein [Candidatus Auribacterota bacterium]
MKKWNRIAGCCLWLFIAASGIQAAEKTVEGAGMAAGNTAAAHDEAVNKALRNAVERAVGVMVTSESLVKNFQLVEDQIYSKVEGYVKSYEIIEENVGADNITRVKVSAVVEETKLEEDLAAIKLILKAKGNPRTMVTIRETVDGTESNTLSSSVEQFFSSKSFPIVDMDQMEKIKARDAADAETDPQKAKALGNRFGAELIISGNAQAQLSSQTTAYNVPVYAFSGTLAFKAIDANSGAVLSILNETETGRGGNPAQASQQAFTKAWEKGRDAFFGTLMEKWRSSVLNTTDMILVVSKCSAEKRTELKDKLSSVEGIKDCIEKTFNNGVCEFALEVDGAVAGSLDEKIVESIPDLSLTVKTGDRLDFEFKADSN